MVKASRVRKWLSAVILLLAATCSISVSPSAVPASSVMAQPKIVIPPPSTKPQQPAPTPLPGAQVPSAGPKQGMMMPEHMTDAQRVLWMKGIFTLPPKVEYSNNLCLTRGSREDHKTGVGNEVWAVLAIFDILNEMEAGYAPDLSYGFLRAVSSAGGKTLQILKDKGCATELSFPSYSSAPRASSPLAESYRDASSCRVAAYANAGSLEGVTVDAAELKRMLVAFGPVLARVEMQDPFDLLGGRMMQEYVAIIGYDDRSSMFEALAEPLSEPLFYDKPPRYLLLPYASVTNPPVHSGSPHVDWVRWVQLVPGQALLAHPYAAHLEIRHAAARQFLKVAIGVEGEPSLTVWDPPNPAMGSPRSDWAEPWNDLKIDVPLPSYAKDHWPPSQSNRWYVDVTEDARSGLPPVVSVLRANLVHREAGVPAQPGRDGLAAKGRELRAGETIRFYIPARDTTVLTLEAASGPFGSPPGPGVRWIRGKATRQIEFSDRERSVMPLRSGLVTITADPEPRDAPRVQLMADPATGQFQVPIAPAGTTTYQAYITDQNGWQVGSDPVIVTPQSSPQ